MLIEHLQSSTQIVQMGDIRLLTDPWLTDGEYYGSWYHYPPFPESELQRLDYDFIYVSHIHPDHLSEETFRRLPKKTPVLIHNYDSKFVKRKLEMLGYDVIECDHGVPYLFQGGGKITIYSADNCNPELCSKFFGCAVVETTFGSTQIDTLAVFEYKNQVVINTNDCPFELAETAIRANKLNALDVDLLLVGYAGAGPYPQCFEFDTEEEQRKAARDKKQEFLGQAIKYIDLVKPKIYAPFAGTYILGSRLMPLTELRGVPSLSEALKFLGENVPEAHKGLLFEQFDVFDLDTCEKIEAHRTFGKSFNSYLEEISKHKLAFDDDEWNDAEIPDLMRRSYERFKAKAAEIGFASNSVVVVQSDRVAYKFSLGSPPKMIDFDAELPQPFVRLTVNHNLLHRLLRGPRFAHWNNAEIGSHIQYQRRPHIFERGLYHCLCFLHS